MSDQNASSSQQQQQGGRGFGGRGGRQQGGRGGRQNNRNQKKKEGEKWIPCTKLGRLVKEGLISSLEEVYLMSLPIKEYQIIDHFVDGKRMKDEVLKICPVQKQTTAGQRTRFKAFVIIGDGDGHCGLGIKCAKEVATAIRGAIILAKLSLIPIRRGYWGSKMGLPHTVPMKLSGKCGSVLVKLIPAPRGTGIVAARVPKKLLNFAGLQDCYTSSTGHTATLGNFVQATFIALSKSYGYLTPDLWFDRPLPHDPLAVHAEYLAATAKAAEEKRLQVVRAAAAGQTSN